MHEIMDKKFYLGPKFGTLFNKKWITISELLQLFLHSGDCKLHNHFTTPMKGKPGPLHNLSRRVYRGTNCQANLEVTLRE
jgi:hypothetical protein